MRTAAGPRFLSPRLPAAAIAKAGLSLGRIVVFEPAEAKPPAALTAFWQATRPVFRHHDDPLTLDADTDYFRELYWQKGEMSV